MNLLANALELDLHNHSRFGCTSTAALERMPRYESDVAECPYTLVMLGGNDSDFDWPAVAATPEEEHECNTCLLYTSRRRHRNRRSDDDNRRNLSRHGQHSRPHNHNRHRRHSELPSQRRHTDYEQRAL